VNPQETLELALLVRRGQLRLKDVPEVDRANVRAVANKVTDAQIGTILAAREHNAKQFGRTTVKMRHAMS
jgi:hypothetical protein